MKRLLLGCSAILWLAGCYPALRTVQPNVKLFVQDAGGHPVVDATFTLATYRYPFPSQATTKFARYKTDSAGALSIPRRSGWQMEILLPDGSAWYAWAYCIEKEGYRAVAVAEASFKKSMTVVLQPHPESSYCEWSSGGVGVKVEAMDAESREDAVRAAEQFIRDGHYDTPRRCPEELARLDAQGLYDMQPHCQHYAAAEQHAFAVQETELFWAVYFRKVPPTCHGKEESFRVVQVFRSAFSTGPRVVLKDIELSLQKEAEVLRPNKTLQPRCEDG
jgi:hypothetical protein